jgi:hypothetical protein
MFQITSTEVNQELFDIEVNQIILILQIVSEIKSNYSLQNTHDPVFKYHKFNGYKLQRLFFSQRLERIQDDYIRQRYEDVIYEYSPLIECLGAINQG